MVEDSQLTQMIGNRSLNFQEKIAFSEPLDVDVHNNQWKEALPNQLQVALEAISYHTQQKNNIKSG